MSWLGNGFREEAQSLADAYASMYEEKDAMKNAPSIKDAKVPTKTNVKNYPGLGIAPTIKKEETEQLDQEFEIVDEYSVSVEDGIDLEEGKKKCKEGYKWDSDKGKCVKKKKKSSSNKTTIIVTGRGGYYGGLHGHGGSNGGDDGDKETESNGGDGGDGGGGGE